MEPDEEREPPPSEITEWLEDAHAAAIARKMFGWGRLGHALNLAPEDRALCTPIFAMTKVLETEDAETVTEQISHLDPSERRSEFLRLFDEFKPGFAWDQVNANKRPGATYCDSYCLQQIAVWMGFEDGFSGIRDEAIREERFERPTTALTFLRGLQAVRALSSLRGLSPEATREKLVAVIEPLSRGPVEEPDAAMALLKGDLARESIERSLGIARPVPGTTDGYSEYLEFMNQAELEVVNGETRHLRPEEARQRFLELVGLLLPDGLRR